MSMQGPRRASAFAPAAITNFFEVAYDSSSRPTGATGGGYVLSKGTTSTAILLPRPGMVETTVNGDRKYDARTTRRAVGLLFAGEGLRTPSAAIEQTVETPVGSGFGSSAASATSAVYAAAAAAGVSGPKARLARYAYRAEIIERTGLGTVSVVYDFAGAGAIMNPGEPGESAFRAVRLPPGTRVVTAFVRPFDKRGALSSPSATRRINRLGRESLRSFLADPTLDNLGAQGEAFSGRLGLESPEVKKLIAAAKGAGADHASQNMIGYSVHCVSSLESSARVERALRGFGRGVRVDVFEVGTKKARVLRPTRRSQGPS